VSGGCRRGSVLWIAVHPPAFPNVTYRGPTATEPFGRTLGRRTLLRAVRNLGLDEMRELRERLLPPEVALLGRNRGR
jgi:hypothetical protein